MHGYRVTWNACVTYATVRLPYVTPCTAVWNWQRAQDNFKVREDRWEEWRVMSKLPNRMRRKWRSFKMSLACLIAHEEADCAFVKKALKDSEDSVLLQADKGLTLPGIRLSCSVLHPSGSRIF